MKKEFLLLIIFLLAAFSRAQSGKLRFDRITTANGLSSNHISYISQDSKGFLWICTQDGINRYDGYRFKHYKHIPGNLNSISDYAANHIFEDSNGMFWISTREGLNKFDPASENFTHFKPEKDTPNSLSNEKIVCTTEDKFGNIWIGTRNGLNIYDEKSNTFTSFLRDPSDEKSLSYNYITAIYYDQKGNLWIGSQRGLNKFNYNNKTFDVFYNEPGNKKSINGNLITSFFEDSRGSLWIGTTTGLNKLDSIVNNIPYFTGYIHQPSDKFSLSSSNIRIIDEDSKGNLWIATLGGGLNIFYPDQNRFVSYKYKEDNITGLSENFILSLFIDDNDNVWIGTNEKGINKYTPARERFQLFQPVISTQNIDANNMSSILIDDKNLWLGTAGNGIKIYNKENLFYEFSLPEEIKAGKGGLSSNNISCIFKDYEGIYWIGTFGGGLNMYDPSTKKFEVFKYSREDLNSIGNDFIHYIYEDSKGILWVGTGLGGLNRFDKKTKSFKRYRENIREPDNPKYLNSPEVTAISEDEKGFLWIGTTTGGLSRFNPVDETFKHHSHLQGDSSSLSSNRIVSLYFDSKKRLWVGTFGGGLNLYIENDNSFRHYLVTDGLPGNTVKAIIEDNSGNLWLTTDIGISKFNPEAETFTNFDESDGLQGKEYNEGAVFKDPVSQKIYFGGVNGLNIFLPESVPVKRKPPGILITDFKLFNKSVLKNYPSLQDQGRTNEINLSYDENIVSIEFAAMDFTSPEKNQYAYMLENFDRDWIYSGNKREATYTNLDPGSYTFKVKGSNSDGVWNEEGISLSITIDPPFWRTWWAYLVYVLIAAFGFVAIRRYELNRVKLRNELRIKEFESKKLLEVDQIKSRFFTNLSHEFRTPLTIILGSLEKMKKEADEKEYTVMKRNASRLLQLINQLLELSKIESGNIKLNASESDIVKFLRRITASFSSLAARKKINLNYKNTLLKNNQAEEIFIYYDKKKLESVFYNLLSNAIKFTPENETIEINLSEKDENVEIKFTNTGVSIPSEEINKIFDRFYQVDDSGTRNFEGTGIGLSLAKEYVELHKGRIEVSSSNNQTSFMVVLRKGKSHLNEDEIADEEDKKLIEPEYYSDSDEPISLQTKEEISESEKTIILVVEDNPDLREMIREILQDEYKVIEAENGVQGLKTAVEIIPDLIISDIMMPEMDGYKFSYSIKTNEKTNHIPVVLLTAKADTKDKLEGLETGADDYIIKPFDENELKVRIRNLIKIRRQMREKFQSRMFIQPGKVDVSSTQKVFIDKLTSILEKNISLEGFSVEMLCEEIGMSRTQLHRKIKAVTNQSASEFIRNFRLQRAAELLQKDAGNIAQISYEVGFSSQSYFTKMFQQLYGLTPLEYKKQHTE